jgi:acetolactate synthase-1/2/3 large subunit
MRGFDAVASILKQEGVEYLFAYPNNALIDAAAALGIRPVIARSEKTLINMADGYCRATNGRRPTVVVVQAGPGIENAFGGIAQAYADGVPLLIIPGGPNQRRGGQPVEFDPLPTYRNVTKWSGRITHVERVPELMRRAFSLLRNGPTGPVLLELPGDVGAAEVDAVPYESPRRARSSADPESVSEAARLLIGARRPVLHAGHGVLWAEAWDELRELAETAQLPVMTTMAGKSAFPEDHPLSLGTGGHTVTGQAAGFLVRSDVILAIGSGLARNAFTTLLPPGKTIVQSTIDPADLDKEYPTDLALLGDAKLVLRQLIDEIARQGGRRGSSGLADEIGALRKAFRDEWMARLTSDETPINPYRVIWELNQIADKRSTIVTHDSGNPRDQILTFYEATAPRGYLGWGKSTQLGTGYGIALGAKLAFPEKLCVNLMGDLAFGTAGMEVETAVRERIPIMTVLVNNSVMGGYGHHMPSASQKFGSNKLSGTYWKVAEGLGAYAERVESAADVASALKRGVEATRQGRPVVLEFITKEEPVYPAASAAIEAASKQLAGAPARR